MQGEQMTQYRCIGMLGFFLWLKIPTKHPFAKMLKLVEKLIMSVQLPYSYSNGLVYLLACRCTSILFQELMPLL